MKKDRQNRLKTCTKTLALGIGLSHTSTDYIHSTHSLVIIHVFYYCLKNLPVAQGSTQTRGGRSMQRAMRQRLETPANRVIGGPGWETPLVTPKFDPRYIA